MNKLLNNDGPAVTDKGSKGDLAVSLFKQGYNCAQAVAGAFSEEMSMDRKSALRLASSFGGGMGRMREVCGAVSGMFIVAGMLYGYSDSMDKKAKDKHYALIQEMGKSFKNENGSLICRNLLSGSNLEFDSTPESTPRSTGFYKKRPCAELVRNAANIMEEVIGRGGEI